MAKTAGFHLPDNFRAPRRNKERLEFPYGLVIAPLAKNWMRFVQRLEVVIQHPERIPTTGGALIAVNHTGYWDFVYGGAPAFFNGGRLVRFMAKKEIFDVKGVGALMRSMKHIPVDRADGERSVKEAVARLRKGQLIGIFPEATISRSFEIKELRPGAARIAHEAGVPLIPVTIWGSQRVWTKGFKPVWRPKNAKLVITVGEPIEVSDDIAATTQRLHDTLVAQLKGTQEEYISRFGPMPEGEHWVPARLGGSAPTLESATIKDRKDAAARKARREAERDK